MPYVDAHTRFLISEADMIPNETGHLNYAITKLIIAYQKEKGLNYQTINDIVGALERAKLEFYRRVAAPYENAKMMENGDVYD